MRNSVSRAKTNEPQRKKSVVGIVTFATVGRNLAVAHRVAAQLALGSEEQRGTFPPRAFFCRYRIIFFVGDALSRYYALLITNTYDNLLFSSR